MDYIKEMRDIIGNKPLLLVGTSIIAVKDKKILLQRRADNGMWGYPGGYMEIGETPEESAKREFKEETGLEAGEINLYGVFAGEERHHIYPNGHEVYITDIVFICREFYETGDTHDDEVIEIKWFPFENLPDNLHLTVKDILEKFVADYSKQILAD
jgi:mutator protein MutT